VANQSEPQFEVSGDPGALPDALFDALASLLIESLNGTQRLVEVTDSSIDEEAD
jgi:hypothetical protein